jgi:hypothetical protein
MFNSSTERQFYQPAVISSKNKIMPMKTRLIRKEYDANNSLFFIKVECITDVWDSEGNRLKFDYNIPNEKLTIFGDYEGIYVLYQ